MRPHRALLAAALALSPMLANAAEAWVASATEKIRPGTAARSATSAHVSAARNEFEAFQVVVTGPARGVSARISGLEGLDAKLYRVDLIDLAQPSAVDGGTGRWPDALVPDVDDVVGEQRNAFPFDVGTGESRAIWVEVHVPAGARAGAVKGAVTVATSEGVGGAVDGGAQGRGREEIHLQGAHGPRLPHRRRPGGPVRTTTRIFPSSRASAALFSLPACFPVSRAAGELLQLLSQPLQAFLLHKHNLSPRQFLNLHLLRQGLQLQCPNCLHLPHIS